MVKKRQRIRKKPLKRPWVAGLLSFLVAGLGQIYNKQYLEGIIFIFAATVAYLLSSSFHWTFSLLFWAITLYSVYDAYKTAKRTINQQPNKIASWIVIVIFIILFLFSVCGIYGIF